MRSELPALIEARAVADLFHINTDTLAKWRRAHRGPEYFQISGKRVMYSLGAMERWLESRRRGGAANIPRGQEHQHRGGDPPSAEYLHAGAKPVRAGLPIPRRFRRHATRHDLRDDLGK
jgi:hypothetical protein